ncbi:MAG: DUF3313 family protein [Gammaproteobacteria bacterium]
MNILKLLPASTLVLFLAANPSIAADGPGHTSHDGLKLVKKNRSTELYIRPGVSLAQYKRIAILDCPVAFRKNWERDQNNEVVDPMNRVDKKDMDRIKSELSKEFRRIFTRELQEKGGYTVVDTGGEDVLILRPAIINLDVTAPDKMTPGMSETFTASALSMTLYLELYDSVSSQILARYIHADGDREGMVQISNRVTNKAAADRVLTRWADRLRKGLDDAHKETGSQSASVN